MENELLMAAGFGFARLTVLALIGYAIFRVLTATPKRIPVRAQISYPQKSLKNTRN